METGCMRPWIIVLMVGMAIASDRVVVGAEGPPRESGKAHAARKIRVFVLAGQSNAVGYNDVKEYKRGQSELPDDFRNQPDILFWNDRRSSWISLRIGESAGNSPG